MHLYEMSRNSLRPHFEMIILTQKINGFWLPHILGKLALISQCSARKKGLIVRFSNAHVIPPLATRHRQGRAEIIRNRKLGMSRARKPSTVLCSRHKEKNMADKLAQLRERERADSARTAR